MNTEPVYRYNYGIGCGDVHSGFSIDARSTQPIAIYNNIIVHITALDKGIIVHKVIGYSTC